tara:strand:+ start:13748 stop:14095 length:348 start_codon:yes stop_codon:yes gene_type:complete
MDLQENIKRWVKLDNDSKKLAQSMKELREEKNNISSNLFDYFSNNNMKPPNVNISDGKLGFVEVNTANVLTYKFLEECLNEYFDESKESKELINFIKSKRSYSKNKIIRRLYNKE